MPQLVLQRLAEERGWLEGEVEPKLRRRHRRRMAERIMASQDTTSLARHVETLVEEVRQQLKQERLPQRVLHHLQASKRLLEKLTPDQIQAKDRFELQAEAADPIRLELLLNPSETTSTTSSSRTRSGPPHLRRLQRRLSQMLFRQRQP